LVWDPQADIYVETSNSYLFDDQPHQFLALLEAEFV